MLSIIIPVLNEETILDECQTYYRMLGRTAELIFVDGGSVDMTVARAKRFGAVLQTRPGRSYQKNFGAQHASGECLLFLNVDTFISEDVIRQTQEAVRAGARAGCFTMRIRDTETMFRLYEWAVNGRARRQAIVDADLGMFVRRDVFEALGGFDKMIIMDDILFSKRLRRRYALTVLNATIEVSARKWHQQGFLRTFTQYSLAYLQLWTGIPFFRDRYHEQEQRERSYCLRPRAEAGPGQDPAFDGS